jgi:hypothetical protein
LPVDHRQEVSSLYRREVLQILAHQTKNPYFDFEFAKYIQICYISEEKMLNPDNLPFLTKIINVLADKRRL